MNGISRAFGRAGLVCATLMLGGCAADQGAADDPGQGSTLGPSPTAAAIVLPFSGSEMVLQPGRYVMAGFTSTVNSAWWPEAVTASLPGGWGRDPSTRGSGLYRGNAATPDAKLEFLSVDNVSADPCWPDYPPPLIDPPVGPTVGDLVAALGTVPGVQTSAPVDVTLDGFPGQQLTLAVPVDVSECEYFQLWVTPAMRGETWGFSSVPGWRHQLWVLDLEGLRFVVDASVAPDAPADAELELRQIIESIDIEL